QNLRRLVFEILQRGVERDARRNRPLNSDSIELLEALQLARLGRRLQSGEGRQRNELAASASDVHLRQLIGRQALAANHLRNDFVAAALNAETIDVVSAQQDREIAAGLSEVHALGAELVAIEHHARLRLVELQVGVREHELAAGERFLHELIG